MITGTWHPSSNDPRGMFTPIFTARRWVVPANGGCQLSVIELQAMEYEMVDANKMAEAIIETGRVSLYGIYFDTDKATIKQESQPTLQEIGKLLEQHSELQLVIVGHTDNQGSFDYNMNLSRLRADAVKRELVSNYGIAAARLESWGVAYLAPVASNGSDEGRAKNRRVDLVER